MLHFFRSGITDTFSNWGRSFKIEFDIIVNGPIIDATLGWVDIFGMSVLKPGQTEYSTNGNNIWATHGGAIPAIFANYDGRFRVHMAMRLI